MEKRKDSVLKKYKKYLEKALKKVKISLPRNSQHYKQAQDFVEMAKNYYLDGKYFERKGDRERALAAYAYAHAWLDAGVRLGFLDGKKDYKLFTHSN